MAWQKRKKSVAPIPTSDEPEEWDYFDYGELQHGRGSAAWPASTSLITAPNNA